MRRRWGWAGRGGSQTETERRGVRAKEPRRAPGPWRGRWPRPRLSWPAGLTVVLHLLQDSDPALLLPWVVEEDAVEDVARPEDLLGEDVEQQVVDGQVPLDAVLPHLAQGQVDEVDVAPLVHVVLRKVLHRLHEARLVPHPIWRLPKQLHVGCQGLDRPPRGFGWAWDQRRIRVVGGCAAVEAPRGLGQPLRIENHCWNVGLPVPLGDCCAGSLLGKVPAGIPKGL